MRHARSDVPHIYTCNQCSVLHVHGRFGTQHAAFAANRPDEHSVGLATAEIAMPVVHPAETMLPGSHGAGAVAQHPVSSEGVNAAVGPPVLVHAGRTASTRRSHSDEYQSVCAVSVCEESTKDVCCRPSLRPNSRQRLRQQARLREGLHGAMPCAHLHATYECNMRIQLSTHISIVRTCYLLRMPCHGRCASIPTASGARINARQGWSASPVDYLTIYKCSCRIASLTAA